MILIILIICEIITRQFDSHLLHPKIKHFSRPKFYDYQVIAIGLTRSITYFFPNPKSDINSHTDIILYTIDRNHEFKYILIYEDHYSSKSLSESISSNEKYNFYTDLKIVKPNKYFKFKRNNFTYRITEMNILNDVENENSKFKKRWTVGEVYDLYKEILRLPYHRLKFNCHHATNLVLNIVLNKPKKHFLNMFEFDNNEDFKVLLYVYNYLKEKFGFKVVDLNILKFKNKLKQFKILKSNQ